MGFLDLAKTFENPDSATGLERFPTGWTHPVDEKSLQIQNLEHIRVDLIAIRSESEYALEPSATKLPPVRRTMARAKRALRPWLTAALCVAFCSVALLRDAAATPSLLIDEATGAVLYESESTQPWFPASVTKLMTVYVALQAVRDHRLTLDTPLAVSARAASMPPSKMGFKPGSLVTLGNALKMLMVKSANDLAITIAEGVSGSVEAFADEMNAAAASLGLSQSHFVNPNGLPDPRHVSSARDLAILARALYQTFPEQADLFGIGALRLGGKIIANHNNLLGRYPGVDGMKTGFTCAAGFNLVASATQGGKRLIAVVLGAPNATQRMIKAAALFDRGFAGIDHPGPVVNQLPTQADSAAPDRHNAVCRARGKAIAEFSSEIEAIMAPLEAAKAKSFASQDKAYFYDSRALAGISPMASRITLTPPTPFEPVPVFVGPGEGYVGPIAQARPPHSPIGTPGEASAYTGDQPSLETSVPPLAPRTGALPIGRARGAQAEDLSEAEPKPPAHRRGHAHPAAKAKSQHAHASVSRKRDETASIAASKTTKSKAAKSKARTEKASAGKPPKSKAAAKGAAGHDGAKAAPKPTHHKAKTKAGKTEANAQK